MKIKPKPGDLVYIEELVLEDDKPELGMYIRYWEMHPGYWRHEIYWFDTCMTSNETLEKLLLYRDTFLNLVKNEAA